MDHHLTPDETAILQRDQLARELDDLRQRFGRGGTVLILPEGAVLQVVTVDASKATGTAFFQKQMGANAVDSSAVDITGPDGRVRYRRAVGHPDIDEAVATPGYTVQPAALRFKDKAGADPDEWPEDLRVQEWPTV